ncbi:MAG: methionine--tRNA ligase [Candidatus Aureabacteria bacterium]|nr:methionine--tRNA ligase [Candidatus Auribacterota bacterium]
MKKFYVTTAIDYVNAPPHLGHAYEKVCADVMRRFKRAKGFDTFFSTGVDEHSLNVYRQAKDEGISPMEYCNRMVPMFVNSWESLNIEYDRFIRTTDDNHIKSVRHLLQKIYDKGDIYMDKYKGWYCVSCEAYLQESELVDGKCPVHNKKAEWFEEDNYFFRLSKYADKLLEHIEKHNGFILPTTRENEIVNIIKNGLLDISISRASEGWGIKLPFDENQIIYVWIDALTNYMSAAGYSDNNKLFNKYWPANLHIIGKDITRFHSIIWPAMLMSGGLTLPERIYAHGFMTIDGKKMSKTGNNFIAPDEIVGLAGSDAVRYFVMREMPFGDDMDFTWSRFWGKYNSDLANDFGNLVSRTFSMVDKYAGGKVPKFEAAEDIDINYMESIKRPDTDYFKQMENCQFALALNTVWEIVAKANRYVEETKPWRLNKTPLAAARLGCVLLNLLESLRIISSYSYPFMPVSSEKVWRALGMDEDIKEKAFAKVNEWEILEKGRELVAPGMLFPRKDIK